MKIGSIIVLAVLAVFADAHPKRSKAARKQRRRLRSASHLADSITEELEQPLLDKIKQRYEAGMKELPPAEKRALKSSKNKNLISSVFQAEPEPETTPLPVVPEEPEEEEVVPAVTRDTDFVIEEDIMSMSMSMSMSMDMFSMSMPMSMSMSMSM